MYSTQSHLSLHGAIRCPGDAVGAGVLGELEAVRVGEAGEVGRVVREVEAAVCVQALLVTPGRVGRVVHLQEGRAQAFAGHEAVGHVLFRF